MMKLFPALLVLVGAPFHAADARSEKTNIIYIMADERGYYEPGFISGRTIKTPNLDRLATEGNAVQKPLCRLLGVCAYPDAVC